MKESEAMTQSFPEIKDVQRVELEILAKFDSICREQGLTYFLDSGTALGAMRHQGFIPWDDDIDVGMPREDYDRFMEIGQELLGEEFFLQNRESDPNSPFSFAKIRKEGTTFVEWNKRNIAMHHGIFIDIFPFDVLPEEEEGRDAYMEHCLSLNAKLIRRMIPDRAAIPEKNWKWRLGALARRLQYYAAQLVPAKKIDDAIAEAFPRYRDRGFAGHDCTSHSYATKIVFPSEIFFPPCEMEFEGHTFFAPADCDRYLTLLYGDYMQLPPVEQRYGHRPIAVSAREKLY